MMARYKYFIKFSKKNKIKNAENYFQHFVFKNFIYYLNKIFLDCRAIFFPVFYLEHDPKMKRCSFFHVCKPLDFFVRAATLNSKSFISASFSQTSIILFFLKESLAATTSSGNFTKQLFL